MDFVDLILRLIGAFYVFASFVAARVAATSLLLDRAIAAITLDKPARADVLKAYWLLAASVLLMAGGAALLVLLGLAVWAFLASALGQAVYLFYLAPRYFDAADPPDAAGRRQSTNAFVIYLVATACVVWAYGDGRLTRVSEAAWPALVIPAVLVVALLAYVLRSSRGLASYGQDESVEDERLAQDEWEEAGAPPPDLSAATSVKVMADYFCEPLWVSGPDLSSNVLPAELGLSPGLSRDLIQWADAFDNSIDHDNPAVRLWSDEEHAAHVRLGRSLAVRVARERPDLIVYAVDAENRAVDVRADDDAES